MKVTLHPDHQLPSGGAAIESSGARLGCFAPTHAVFTHHGSVYAWSSRYHRPHPPHLLPVWFGYPFADISYWVGLVFTLGCVAWVVNGHYALFPHGATASSDETAKKVAAAAALAGGTLFEIGSWLLYWEALNPEAEVATGKELTPVKTPATAAAAAAAAPAAAAQYTTGRTSTESLADAAADAAERYTLHPVANQRARLLVLASQQRNAIPGRTSHSAGALAVSTEHADQNSPSLKTTAAEQDTANPRDIETPAPRDGNSAVSRSTKPQTDSAVLMKQRSSSRFPNTASSSCSYLNGAAAAVTADAHGNGSKTKSAAGPHRWCWFGMRAHDLGFMGSFLQLIGATIFWVPCIFGAPGVYPAEDAANFRIWDGVYWLLQVVGASFFIASSLFFMLEVQPAWYRPKPLMIGWHVGFWNLVGAVGFWLSGFFGFWEPVGKYQLGGTVLSTFWGSYAFLLGSYLQLIEAVNKHTESLSMRRRRDVRVWK